VPWDEQRDMHRYTRLGKKGARETNRLGWDLHIHLSSLQLTSVLLTVKLYAYNTTTVTKVAPAKTNRK
jgi:hypothetical protein